MKVDFRKSFLRDLKRVKEPEIRERLRETIYSVERAQSLQKIGDVRKLKYGDRFYRIRIGDYRLGLAREDDTLVFVRFLHRKDLYKYFP